MRFGTLAMAVAAVMSVAACNQLTGGGSSGPALPRVQAGATAPSTQAPVTGQVQQITITDDIRTRVTANIVQLLDGYSSSYSGMTRVGTSDDIFAMQPGTDHRAVASLTANQPYVFIGVCDIDCTNVDIELIDMTTGGVVASDMLPDDYPIVNFTPTANGQYMVRLLLQNCTTAPCFAGTRTLTSTAAPGGGK